MPLDSREEELVRLLTEPRKRAILSNLEDAAGPLSVDELADRIVAQDSAILRPSEYETERKRARLSLHHRHLPELEDAGVIEYDRDEKVATSRDVGVVDADWLDVERIDELLDRLGSRPATEADVGVLTGRENVLEYGADLVGEAQRELFFMYVTDDLLTETCFSCKRKAVERGVDVSIGSPDPAVREQCRTRLSGATVWEPQYDWLNLSSSYPKVGRLVFADRRNLMVGLVEEPADDGSVPETVMIGEGEDNPLVVLVRELLGPRLDHLDFQSEDFGSHLPS